MGVSQAVSQQQKMNVLFILADDLKPVTGCYGSPIALTPNIDAIASRGTLFMLNYCQQALSGPSRASMLTGQRPDHTRIWDMKHFIREQRPGIVTMPEYFKNNGYRTAASGKVFDPRTVDEGHDGRSWSVPYINDILYLNSKSPKPTSGYQGAEAIAALERAKKEAAAKGLKGKDAALYVKGHAGPATECADVSDDAYLDGALARAGVETIKKLAAGDKPFFFAIGFHKPHTPFVAPKKYWDMYDRQQMKMAEFQGKPQNAVEIAFPPSQEIRTYCDIPPVYTFNDSRRNNGTITPEKQLELLHGYYACVSYIDAMIGQVIGALKEAKADKNTIIVVIGDHGWHLGDHGLWGKHSNFEQATRSPLIISDPRIGASVTGQVSEFVDIFPTLCSMTGLPVPGYAAGVDLTRTMKDPDRPAREYAVSQYPRNSNGKGVMGYSLRDGRFRYTVWIGDNFDSTKPYNPSQVIARELYDYATDPLETVNCAGDKKYASTVASMDKWLQEFLAKQVGQL